VELNEVLSEKPVDPKFGGRHPLPSIENFNQFLNKLGINEDSHVIVYDTLNSSNCAARMWWMLKAAGIEHTQVLNGGLRAVEKYNIQYHEVSKSKKTSKNYKFHDWKLPIADIDLITEFTVDDEALIIDVREEKRFSGKEEPLDLVAGHIPSAINLPFKSNLTEEGLFKTSKALHAQYKDLLNNKNINKIAIHCGSGVTACHTILAFAHANLPIPKLYIGSWSEWSRNNKPIEKN
jgi:thiosulfate/3-mercaptopyruvate sulfurtransferase